MGFHLSLFLLLVSLPLLLAEDVARSTIIIDGAVTVAKTDDNFICATIDWWPHDKCNYNLCPWWHSSVLNLNLSQPLLAKAVQAFKRLRIRIGGSLQDQVLYDMGNLKTPCHPFQKMKGGLFGFSKGCLHKERWDELNHFFSKTGAIVTFGLNALYGRHPIGKGAWEGAWDSSNAHDFINYTVSKGYEIDSWEFGNELSGTGVGASVSAELYGKDTINLKNIIKDLYKNSNLKPSLIAPGGFFDQQWFAKFLQVSGSGILDSMTHHIYNLGPGDSPNLVNKILDPTHLNKISETFSNLAHTIQQNGPWSSAWVGEAGGAFNSGGHDVSDTFVNSFWYVDQLGMASKYNTKVYCRQTLIGGHYGLLNRTTLAPYPDYYSALLWDRLMGNRVLAVGSDASPYLRAYAHCSKGRPGITLLLINLSNHTNFIASVQNSMNMNLQAEENSSKKSTFMHRLKKSVSWVGSVASGATLSREEYHLTPKDGYLRSKTMVLNGIPLQITEKGDIPKMEPVLASVDSPLNITPMSILFIVFPNFDAPACA